MPAVADKLLLIGWDAAEWNVIRPLIDAGQMPHLRSLLARGASASLHSFHPLISPLLWTSAVTGKHAHKHDILGPLEAKPDRSGTRAVSRAGRRAKGVWEILDDVSMPTIAVNFPATHPANSKNGAIVSNYFALGRDAQTVADSVWPAAARDALAGLRVATSEIDAASLLTFVPRAADISTQVDPRLTVIARILAHTATVHAAATWCLEHLPWRFAGVCYTGLHQFSHGFMPYHPPRLAGISDHNFELYGNVITAAYRFHDLMLGRLLELAGNDTTVMLISDHGFQCDERRPGSAIATSQSMLAWHRDEGVLVLAGKGIRPGAQLAGAELLDIAPTILSLLDVPSGADMDGRPWDAAIGRDEPLDRRVSWEDRAPTASASASLESPTDESVAHLLELGYVEQPDRFANCAIDQIERENQFVLALVWMETGDPQRAVPMLESMLTSQPDSVMHRIALARAYAMTRQTGACRNLVEQLASEHPCETAVQHTSLGMLELEARRADSALKHLRRAEELGTVAADLFLTMGRAHLRLARWEDARRVLQLALDREDQNVSALQAMAAATLGAGDPSGAIVHAKHALQLRPDCARAHYLLGAALLRLRQTEPAIGSLQASLAINPRMAAAHRRLAAAYASIGDDRRARAHEREAHAAMVAERMRRGYARES